MECPRCQNTELAVARTTEDLTTILECLHCAMSGPMHQPQARQGELVTVDSEGALVHAKREIGQQLRRESIHRSGGPRASKRRVTQRLSRSSAPQLNAHARAPQV